MLGLGQRLQLGPGGRQALAGGADGGLGVQGGEPGGLRQEPLAAGTQGDVRLLQGDLGGIGAAVGLVGGEEATPSGGESLPQIGLRPGLVLRPLAIQVLQQGAVLGPILQMAQTLRPLAQVRALGADAPGLFFPLGDEPQLLAGGAVDRLILLGDAPGHLVQGGAVLDTPDRDPADSGHRVLDSAVRQQLLGLHALQRGAAQLRLPAFPGQVLDHPQVLHQRELGQPSLQGDPGLLAPCQHVPVAV